MAEYRLAKVASELNRSYQILAETLKGKGFSVEAKLTTKITEEMYQVLVQEFAADKSAREEANKLKTNRDGKPLAPPPAAKPQAVKIEEPEPVIILPAKPETPPSAPVEEPEKIEARKEELSGPKILGKIEIATKKGKSAKTEEKTEEKKQVKKTDKPAPEPVTTPEPSAPPVVVAVEEEEEEVEKVETKFEKLSGPKVLGKIELPKD